MSGKSSLNIAYRLICDTVKLEFTFHNFFLNRSIVCLEEDFDSYNMAWDRDKMHC